MQSVVNFQQAYMHAPQARLDYLSMAEVHLLANIIFHQTQADSTRTNAGTKIDAETESFGHPHTRVALCYSYSGRMELREANPTHMMYVLGW